jgi:hypothetical protein
MGLDVVIVTVAPGSAAPERSVMRPVISPDRHLRGKRRGAQEQSAGEQGEKQTDATTGSHRPKLYFDLNRDTNRLES